MGGVVIIGAGQAGSSMAGKLRSLGYADNITLIGEEPVEPYQRPPLSKAYLLGQMPVDRMYLRSSTYWDQHKIKLILGRKVTSINPTCREICFGEKTINYAHLILATGAKPNILPTHISGILSNVYTMRTLADADGMREQFQKGRRLLVIGGGYIGLEAAAVASKSGLSVTLVEASSSILQRVAAVETSDYIRNLHQSQNVQVLENVQLKKLKGVGKVSSALLSNGTELEVDFVIVGVGVSPETSLAEEAGLEVKNGIIVDEFGRTSNPNIWAAGDCANFYFNGERIRLESVGNAIAQAENVAENIMRHNIPYEAKPWFWSDQYDLKLQIAGLNNGYDRIFTRIANDGTSKSIWYYRGDKLLAVDALNDPRAYMIGKRLIEQGKSPTPNQLVDPEYDLKLLLR